MTEYQFTEAEAIGICQHLLMSDIQEETAAWQYLIDTGIAWRHPDRWFASTAKRLIDEGECTYTDRADDRRQQ